MTVYCFFTVCSQTAPHFDPDTADNAKQRNRSHHEAIPMAFQLIYIRWIFLN